MATISSCGFIESLEKVAEMSDWKEKRKNLQAKGKGIGMGCYSFISGGVFNWFNTQYPFSAAEVRAFADGTAASVDHGGRHRSGLGHRAPADSGRGTGPAHGATSASPPADTAMTPKADLGTWGSRVTLMAGNAVLDAARKIKEKLFRMPIAPVQPQRHP